MEWIELGELGEVLSGYAFKSKKYVNKGIRVIRITNVQNGYLEDDDPKYYSEEDIEGLERYLLLEDDILISLTGNVGRVAKLEKKFLPAALNQRVACVRANKRISDEYLYYMLNSNYFENRCISQSKGVAQKNLGITNLKKIKIPVPPMEIQEKIVKVLDQAQALIDKRKEQIEALDQLIESIFYTMFGDPVRNEKGWKVKLLGEHIDVLGGYAFKSKEYTYIGIPIIKIGNINRGFFEEKNLCYYEEREDLNRYIIKPGDLLMSLTGTVGKNDYGNLCIIDDTFEKYYLNQRNAKLEIINSLNKLYLTYLLRTNRLKAELTKNNRGVRQANISNDDIKNLRVPIPPISLQNDFAQKVETIEKQKKLLEESLELLEENYKSIMARAFIGELFK